MLPFLLQPYLRKVIWGGHSLAAFKHLTSRLDHIGESWEVSAMPGCESVVASGPLQGRSLLQVCREHSRELLGHDDAEFPLLIKFIDTDHDLSVQVHPGDDLARELHGCGGKCEMWYIIDSRPGSRLCAGLARRLSLADFEQAVADGSIMSHLAWYPTHPGDTFYLPAGRVHAIGAGNLLLEVQQPSDITYRIYDYGRRDADGRLRDLHIPHACRAIDFSPADDYRVTPVGNSLLDVDFFKVERYDIDAVSPLELRRDSVAAVLCIDGSLAARASDASGVSVSLDIPRGHTMLVPAGVPAQLRGSGTAIIVTP